MEIEDRTVAGNTITVVLGEVVATGQRIIGMRMVDRTVYLSPTVAIRLAEMILEMARREQS